MNYIVPCTSGYVAVVNVIVLHGLWPVECVDKEEPQIWRGNYELYRYQSLNCSRVNYTSFVHVFFQEHEHTKS